MTEIPKFHETFNKILEILSDRRIIKSNELIRTVIETYYNNLPKELLEQKTKSGDNLLINRIAWGKSYLKKGGFIIYPERGTVQITEKGLAQKKILKLEDIESSENFINFYTDESNKTSTLIKSNDIDLSNSSPQDIIDIGFSKIETQIKNELLEKLKSIDPFFFEKVILILLKAMGYGDFVETAKTGDGGIDGIINEDKLGLDRIYIQAKRYGENKVREKDIRNFIGAMSGDTRKGIFVTTSKFDEGAIIKAKDAHHTIILIDGKKLVDLMHEYNVGIQVKSVYEIKELDEDFFEN